jgi:integrase
LQCVDFHGSCEAPAGKFKQKLKPSAMNTKISYTEPVVCQGTKGWFVSFDITNNLTGEKRRVQSRKGMNYFKKKEDRLLQAKAVKDWWKTRLLNGWHPFKDLPDASQLISPTTKLNDALDFALSKVEAASKTKRCYACTIRFFKAAAIKLSFHNFAISDVERQHIKTIFQQVRETRRWTNRAYNKNLGYLCAVMGRLIEYNVIKYNPAEDIKRLRVAESEGYITMTPQEWETVREELYLNHYRLYVIVQIIFHTGLRPKEILGLQVKDINLSTLTISLRPDLDRENSKTKSIRLVPVNEHLFAFLRELDLDNYPADNFVFGSPYESGKGNKGSAKGSRSGAMHPDYFKPSTTMVKRDTLTKHWKKVVMNGVGVLKHLYSMKHMGADAKILAGIPLEALKELYGHQSELMTLKYARKIKEVYRKQIIEQSPAL